MPKAVRVTKTEYTASVLPRTARRTTSSGCSVMSKIFSTNLGELYNVDCLSWLKTQPAQSIRCCITSPPYWGLRNYGVDEQLGQEQTPDEYINNLRQIFQELYR